MATAPTEEHHDPHEVRARIGGAIVALVLAGVLLIIGLGAWNAWEVHRTLTALNANERTQLQGNRTVSNIFVEAGKFIGTLSHNVDNLNASVAAVCKAVPRCVLVPFVMTPPTTSTTRPHVGTTSPRSPSPRPSTTAPPFNPAIQPAPATTTTHPRTVPSATTTSTLAPAVVPTTTTVHGHRHHHK